MKNRRREPETNGNILSDRMLRIKGSAGHSRCTDLHALLSNFKHRVFCAYSLLLYKGVLVRVLNLHRDQKSLARTGEIWKIPLSHRILRLEGSAQYSRCTCVDRPSRSPHEQFRTQASAHRAY